MQGCNEGAKASTDLTHWPVAIAHGARLVTGARVRRLETNERGLVTGATWLDRDGREHFQAASTVVLAANGIGTPRLLLLSSSPRHPDGLANSSGLVGRRLMMHPFASVTGLFDEELESWQGHFGCSIESFEFYETDERRGFVRGAKWGLAPTGGPVNAALPSRAGEQVWGEEHHLHVRNRLGRGASWGLFGEDLPDESNQVTLSTSATDSSGLPAPELHYRVSDNSRRLLDFHIAKASESLVEAGAHTVEVDRLMRYSGWHLLGTARMGSDPATSVVDEWNRAHDVPNLYVVDGSCFVTSGGVNPTSTICALALRAADHLVHDPSPAGGAGMSADTPIEPDSALDADRRDRAFASVAVTPRSRRPTGCRPRATSSTTVVSTSCCGRDPISSTRCAPRSAPSWVTIPAAAWPRWPPMSRSARTRCSSPWSPRTTPMPTCAPRSAIPARWPSR